MNGMLFLNGNPPSKKVLKGIDFDKFFVVCADGAYDYLCRFCTPDLLVGDFDSTKKRRLNAKKIEKLQIEKDFTDGHVAMQMLLDTRPDSIQIYGALGGSPDHQLSNFSLLYLAKMAKVDAKIVSEVFDIFLADGNFVTQTKTGKRVSLVPFTDAVHILDTSGLKYKIKNETYTKMHIKGISNMAEGSQIGYNIASGAALIFVEN